VFESCTPINPKISSQLTQIIQDLPLSFTINVGQVIKDKDGVCWRYVGRFGTNYIPPANVSYSTQSGNYFVGASPTIYNDCTTCIQTPPPCTTRPAGLTDYYLTAEYFRGGNLFPFVAIPTNKFGIGQTYTTACNAWFDYNNLPTKQNIGYGNFEGESQWTVGSVVYLGFNGTNCTTVPAGSYWLQRRSSFAQAYYTNTTLNPGLPNIEIVTINSLGVITAITNCNYQP
jgi:hypothetical protein